jgi:outer membrane protein assembly factor BamB
VRSDPAVDHQGNVYFGSYDFNVYKVNIHGSLVWKAATQGSIFGPVTLDADGTLFVGSFDDHLYAFDSESGRAKWSFDLKAHGDSGWAVAGDLVLGLSNEGGLCTSWPPSDMKWPNHTAGGGHCYAFAINKHTGKLVWKQKTGMPSGGGMVVGDTFFAGSWSSDFVAYDVKTGAKKWTFEDVGGVESHPAYHDGVVFISTETPPETPAGTLYALNATTGKLIWTYTGAADEFNGSPSVSHDTVYVGSNDHYLHAVDRKTGAFKFKIQTCANVFASAAIDDSGRVYITCNTVTGGEPWPGLGEAYAINPKLHFPHGDVVV